MEIHNQLHSRKQQILLVSARLFHSNGYKGTTLQSIANELGMEGPSLYNHIRSKHEILSTLLLSNAREFCERMEEVKSTSETALQKLERLILLHLELTLKNPDTMALMLSEWVHLEKKELKEYIGLRDQYDADFQQILKESIEQGEVIEMQIDLLRFLILSSLRSLYAWCAKYKDFNRIELERSVKAYILNGILRK